MEGLFAVIFIIIGILNFVMKQQQQQNQNPNTARRQQGANRPNPGQQRRYNTQQPTRTAPVFKESPAEGLRSSTEYMPQQMILNYEGEGIEAEDRRRSGSLDYIEQKQSSEGICDEHPEHDNKKKIAPKTDTKEKAEENPIFELTEENLLKSIIMAEVIGPPRSMKRSIR